MLRTMASLFVTVLFAGRAFARELTIPKDQFVAHLPVLPFQVLLVREARIESEEMLLPTGEQEGLAALRAGLPGFGVEAVAKGIVRMEGPASRGTLHGISVEIADEVSDEPLYDALEKVLSSTTDAKRNISLETSGLISPPKLNRAEISFDPGQYPLDDFLVEVMNRKPRLSFDVLETPGKDGQQELSIRIHYQGNLASEDALVAYRRRAEWVGVEPGRNPAELLVSPSPQERALGSRLLQQHPEGLTLLGQAYRQHTDPLPRLRIIPTFRQLVAGPVQNPELDDALVQAVTSARESADVEALVEASYFLAYRKSARATEVTDMVLDECIRRGVQPSAKLQRASDLSRAPRRVLNDAPTTESPKLQGGPRQ